MGKLIFDGTGVGVDIEDRALAHLQVVMGSKLRRGEAFFYSWRLDVSVGGGRNSVWIHPRMYLVFRYHGGRMPQLNARWLNVLSKVANTPTGLHLVTEPDALAAPSSADDAMISI